MDNRLFWANEAQFSRLVQRGAPVLVALMVPGSPFCEPFEEVLKQAAAAFAAAGVTVLQVDCSGDAQGFCRSRQPEAYPHVELFMPANSAKPPAERGGSTSMQVNVRKFVGYYPNLYGLREFLKSSGIQLSS